MIPLLLLLFFSGAGEGAVTPPLPLRPLPSSSHLQWHLTSLSLFIHFGPNTFTDTEWGTGHFPPSLFTPTSLSPHQWALTASLNGFDRLILTAKHHDGFCLWPSRYTNYSVSSSPNSPDIVSLLAESTSSLNISLGLYLSPWDRHESCYGSTHRYNQYYVAQLTELLTQYGEVKEVWLDGAKGEGEKEMEYEFETWFEVIHQHQPGAVIFSDAGPDVRWVGDEAGIGGETCWAMFNRSQVEIGHTDERYSRDGDMYGVDWVPPECDVSIRPGWFWHKSERPKSALTLLDIYYKSVGRNCLLILNVPPNSSGLISDEDLQVLEEFTALRRTIFTHNFAQDGIVTASSTRGGDGDPEYGPSNVLQEGIFSYWAPDECQDKWEVFLDFGRSISFNVLQLQEPIQMGQRVSSFHVDILNNESEWETITFATTIGYKRLLRFYLVRTQFLRVIIDSSRADPLIAYLGIYLDPFSIMYSVPKLSTLATLNGSLHSNESRAAI